MVKKRSGSNSDSVRKEDVFQLIGVPLVKNALAGNTAILSYGQGLSSRKVGATTGASSKYFSSSKTSRISLIDLAGLDRNKLEDVGRHHLQEGKNVKKSLSQLGYVVNALAKETQPDNAPYEGSCLTRIIRESLGGNAKLTVICNISADNRFGQRVKLVRNEPVINEISEDDVNGLSDQIRLLKEELIRAKSDVYSSVGNDDCEEELNIGEEDVKELRQQLDYLHSSSETNLRDPYDKRGSIQSSSLKESCEILSEDDIHFPEETKTEETEVEPQKELPPPEDILESTDDLSFTTKTLKAIDTPIRTSISISSCHRSSILQEPTLSESPKIGNNPLKSMAIPSSLLPSQNNVSGSSESEVLGQSLKHSEHIRKFDNNPNGVQDSLKTWIVALDNQQTDGKTTAVVSVKATNREKELEIVCIEQAAKIEQLNHLVEQYKQGTENCAAEQGPESLKNEIIPFEESNNGESGKENFDAPKRKMDLESNRRCAEKVEMELKLEKNVTEELDDDLSRAVLGHARMLRDTAEAVHAAGELLVRLRKAEQAASVGEENFNNVQQENEKLKKQVEKLKRKHKMEMITMKQYLAESKLPESALQPLYREDSDVAHNSNTIPDDDQAWRAEFGAIYQQHY
ncbi:hypothetical protein CCACVL1_07045 [Corchorus capsularis]|uniref:Kinesin motor domain-containing protein n=1 Tax=Corchorus capsularis TaxID=210143 RepID=A0A1R3JA31_COCAP|nr:hypothetical protein CCACVL1_07045 [Corchorus capsularis]